MHGLGVCTECGGLTWIAEDVMGDTVNERLLFPFEPDIPEEIPEFVQAPFAEAVSSARQGNKMAALTTARAAVQAAMREKGAKQSSIKKEIEELFE